MRVCCANEQFFAQVRMEVRVQLPPDRDAPQAAASCLPLLNIVALRRVARLLLFFGSAHPSKFLHSEYGRLLWRRRVSTEGDEENSVRQSRLMLVQRNRQFEPLRPVKKTHHLSHQPGGPKFPSPHLWQTLCQHHSQRNSSIRALWLKTLCNLTCL